MKIFEIGVGHLHHCRTLQYVGTDVECWLFEPNPECFEELSLNLGDKSNFKLFNYALGGESKEIKLFLSGPSSFIEGVNAPEKNNNPNAENTLKSINVKMKSIQEIDAGDIDILLLDTEGSEFDIIKHLKSRPKQISVEMYSFGVKYKNPHFDEIIRWMNENKYEIADNVWNPYNQPIGEDYVFELISK
jgi:FkbM family methyltransferase